MSKILEIAILKLKKLYKNYIDKIGLNQSDILGFDYCFIELEKELQRLEQIDNSKPSEALERLEGLGFGLWNEDKSIVSINGNYFKEAYNTIKATLLKAQEQEKENKELLTTVAILKQKLEDTDNVKVATTMMKQLDENVKLEKENAEYKRVLKIIFEKGLPLAEIKMIKQSENYEKYSIAYSWSNWKNASVQKTPEEFDLLSEVIEDGNTGTA